jgi:pimeloyl-[acyl-carrier protein] methyl ester esterase
MPFYTTPDGVELYYQVAGDGKPLLFLHGWTMSSRVWNYQVDCFAREYQVITLDLRGHGRSGSLKRECNLIALTRDIRDFIKELQLDTLTLVGWSLAVSLIIRLCHSHRLPVDSLVLVDGTPCFVSREDFPYGLPAAQVKKMRKRIDSNFPRALEDFHSLLLTPEERENRDTIWDLLTNERYLPKQEAARDLLVSLADEDLRSEVTTITMPALLMHGDQDKICPVGASQYMKEHLECAELAVFPGAGHAPFLTQTEDFNQRLTAFLRSRSSVT